MSLRRTSVGTLPPSTKENHCEEDLDILDEPAGGLWQAAIGSTAREDEARSNDQEEHEEHEGEFLELPEWILQGAERHAAADTEEQG